VPQGVEQYRTSPRKIVIEMVFVFLLKGVKGGGRSTEDHGN
jgi:hypothetical protein